MNRAMRRNVEREGEKLERTFNKLSAFEKEKLTELVENKASEYADRAINLMVACLGETLLEFKVSQKRIDEIFLQTGKKMTDAHHDIPRVEIPDHVVLTKNQISDLSEMTLEYNCKECKKKETECNKAKTLKRCGIPPSTWNLGNCRYAEKYITVQRDEEKIAKYQEFKAKRGK